MKKLLINAAIYLSITSALLIGTYFGPVELVRVAMWSVWVLIAVCFIGLFADCKFDEWSALHKFIRRGLTAVLIISLVMTGHQVAASMLLVLWGFWFCKRVEFEKKEKAES